MVRSVLARTVRLQHGRTYQHTCTLESFADVARFVEEHGQGGVTTGMLWKRLDVPCTQATVALEFLKDCGCRIARVTVISPVAAPHSAIVTRCAAPTRAPLRERSENQTL